MELDRLMALVFRYALTAVYIAILIFFKKGYQKSKTAGLPNKFFLGFTFMFLVLIGILGGIDIYETVNAFAPGTLNMQVPFDGYYDPMIYPAVGIFHNFCRPLFVIAFIAGDVLIAGQVYPLEIAINWKKVPITKLLLITGLALFLVFIPVITFTIFTQVLFVASITSLVLGFFLNIGVNIHLARISTGQIRQRSIFIIVAFILFYVGFVWALEVGWTELFIPGATLKYDVIFGSIVQMVAAIFYWVGFRQESTAARPEK